MEITQKYHSFSQGQSQSPLSDELSPLDVPSVRTVL